jgi:hypothetical protein
MKKIHKKSIKFGKSVLKIPPTGDSQAGAGLEKSMGFSLKGPF